MNLSKESKREILEVSLRTLKLIPPKGYNGKLIYPIREME